MPRTAPQTGLSSPNTSCTQVEKPCYAAFTQASIEHLLCAGLHNNPGRRRGHRAPCHIATAGQRKDSNAGSTDSTPHLGATICPDPSMRTGSGVGTAESIHFTTPTPPHSGKAEVRAGPSYQNPCYAKMPTVCLWRVGTWSYFFTCRVSVSSFFNLQRTCLFCFFKNPVFLKRQLSNHRSHPKPCTPMQRGPPSTAPMRRREKPPAGDSTPRNTWKRKDST